MLNPGHVAWIAGDRHPLDRTRRSVRAVLSARETYSYGGGSPPSAGEPADGIIRFRIGLTSSGWLPVNRPGHTPGARPPRLPGNFLANTKGAPRRHRRQPYVDMRT